MRWNGITWGCIGWDWLGSYGMGRGRVVLGGMGMDGIRGGVVGWHGVGLDRKGWDGVG